MRIPGDTVWNPLNDNVGAGRNTRAEPVDALPERLPRHSGHASAGKYGAEEALLADPTSGWEASKGERRQQQRRERSLPTPLDTRISDRRRPPGNYPPIRCKI